VRYYENLFIVEPGIEGDSLGAIKDEYTTFISENGGRVYNVDDWGKRRLAYRIEKQKYGTYVVIQFGADGSLIRELEDAQRLNDAVLSSMIIRLNSEPDLSEKRQRMEEEAADDEDEDEEYEGDEEEEQDEAEETAREPEEADDEEDEAEEAEEADDEADDGEDEDKDEDEDEEGDEDDDEDEDEDKE